MGEHAIMIHLIGTALPSLRVAVPVLSTGTQETEGVGRNVGFLILKVRLACIGTSLDASLFKGSLGSDIWTVKPHLLVFVY